MTSWKDRLALTAQRNRQEIVKAKLDRREMMRLGLLTAGGSLIAKAGLSSRAFGAGLTDKDPTLIRQPPSPPAQAVDGADAAPDGEEAGERPRHAVRPARRHHADRRRNQTDQPPILSPTTPTPTCTAAGAAGSFPPQKFYELTAAGDAAQAASGLCAHHRMGVRRPGSRSADPGQVRRADHGAIPQPPAVGDHPADLRHRRDHHASAQRPHSVGERRQPGQLLQLDQRSPTTGTNCRQSRLQGPALSECAGRLHRPEIRPLR